MYFVTVLVAIVEKAVACGAVDEHVRCGCGYFDEQNDEAGG